MGLDVLPVWMFVGWYTGIYMILVSVFKHQGSASSRQYSSSAIMDVKVVFVISCLCALTIISVEGKDTQGECTWWNQEGTKCALIFTSTASEMSK